MPVCPTQSELRRFCEGEGDSGWRQKVDHHVETCLACKQFLDELDAQEHANDRLAYGVDSVHSARTESLPAVGDPCEIDFGDYIIADYLGEGGMGQVFKARHKYLNRCEVLKVLPADANNATAVARFERERKLLAQLDTPLFVKAHHGGNFKGISFVAMELVHGANLQDVVDHLKQSHDLLRIEDVAAIGLKVAEGLEVAHQKGIVHRDIKPSNIMLTMSGEVKLLDLGLARGWNQTDRSTDLTRPGDVLGTYDYMAPEAFEGTHEIGQAADVYALGCTLFKLLTGNAPFHGYEDKKNAHRTARVPSVKAIRDDVPDELDNLLARIMAKDSWARGTADKVAKELASWSERGDLSGLKEVLRAAQEHRNLKLHDLRHTKLAKLEQRINTDEPASPDEPTVVCQASQCKVVVDNIQKRRGAPFDWKYCCSFQLFVRNDGDFMLSEFKVDAKAKASFNIDDSRITWAQPAERLFQDGFTYDDPCVRVYPGDRTLLGTFEFTYEFPFVRDFIPAKTFEEYDAYYERELRSLRLENCLHDELRMGRMLAADEKEAFLARLMEKYRRGRTERRKWFDVMHSMSFEIAWTIFRANGQPFKGTIPLINVFGFGTDPIPNAIAQDINTELLERGAKTK